MKTQLAIYFYSVITVLAVVELCHGVVVGTRYKRGTLLYRADYFRRVAARIQRSSWITGEAADAASRSLLASANEIEVQLRAKELAVERAASQAIRDSVSKIF